MLFSLLFAALYRVKDDLVDQLFHGSTVISKIDVRRLFLADLPVGNASTGNTFKQRIRQLSGVGKKIAKRCRRIRANDETIFKTSSVTPPVDLARANSLSRLTADSAARSTRGRIRLKPVAVRGRLSSWRVT